MDSLRSSSDSRFDSIVPRVTVQASLRGVAGLHAQSVVGHIAVQRIGVPATSRAQCEENVVSRPAPYRISQLFPSEMPPARLRLRGSRELTAAISGD
jgi:hypothetical protein